MKTNLLRAALFTPGPRDTWGLPMLLWGLPGVAKSAILRWLAAEYDMPIEVLSPAARGEGAFGVTPVPRDERMTYPRPDWTDKFEEAGRGIVFVDEINLAATHYAGALLGLLQDRVLGSHQLGGGIRIFAAANPIDLAAASGGWDLSAPAANRVGHLDWPCPDVRAWTDWLLAEDGNPSTLHIDAGEEERRILKAWPKEWGTARGYIAGFLSANSTLLHALPAVGSNDTSRAWPSPRTWEYAARALASSAANDLTEIERDEFVAAFVGQGAAGEFFTWLSTASLPDSAALLDGKASWQFNTKRLDIATAVFGSATAVCISTIETSLKKRRTEAMWGLLSQVADKAPDLVIPPAKVLFKYRLFDGMVKVASKLLPVIEAAGLKEAA